MRSQPGVTCCSILLICGIPAAATVAPTAHVSSEVAPPGAVMQIKISLDRPRGVSSGVIRVDLDPSFFGDAIAASVFSATGDAYGYVILKGRHVEAHFASESGSIGVVNGLPVCTITAPVLATALPGSTGTIQASTGDAPWWDLQWEEYTVTIAPGIATAGDGPSIGRVEPASGELPAGSTLRIFGAGFSNESTVDIAGAVVSSVQVVGPDRIDVTIGTPLEITGRRIRVLQADQRLAEFFSAFLAEPVAGADDDPLAGARAILPLQPRVSVVTGDLTRRSGWVVVQNPNAVPVEAAVQTRTLNNASSEQLVTLEPGAAAAIPWRFGGGGGYAMGVISSAPVRSTAIWTARTREGTVVGTGAERMQPSQVRATEFLATPDAISWVWSPGSAAPPPQSVTVRASEFQAVGVTVTVATQSGRGWLSATPASLTLTSGVGQQQILVAADPAGLEPGIHRGTVTLTPQPLPFRIVQPVVIAVALTVRSSPVRQTVAACCFQFATPSGLPPSYVYTVAPEVLQGAFTTTFLTDGGGDWLTAGPPRGTTPANVTVSLNSIGTPPGQYSGEVFVTGTDTTVYMPVTYRVYGGRQLYAADYYLLFYAKPGDTTLPELITTVTARCVEAGCPADAPQESIPWTPSVRTSSGGNWLSAAAAGDKLKVGANATGLAAGLYTGAVTLTSPDATGPTQVPVVLIVQTLTDIPALAASPSSLQFSGAAPYSQSTCVQAGRMQVPLIIATTTADGGGWLKATGSSSSEFPCVIQVSVETSGLAPGVYTGSVTASASGQSLDIPVNLAIPDDGAPPVVGAVVNAASIMEGPVSAGEVITLRGSFDPLRCTYCPPSQSAGPLSVSVDGFPVPLHSESSTSVTFAVPRQVDGRDAAVLQVSYGSRSAVRGIALVSAAPGIFTLDGSGQGPAAVLNQDNRVNGLSAPADRGTVIQIFVTGIGVDPPQVTIGGAAAVVTYSGPAPSLADGVQQVNVLVPQDTAPGDAVPVVLHVGQQRSQLGATIAVR